MLLECMDLYTSENCAFDVKAKSSYDQYAAGQWVPVLVLFYGNVQALDTWHQQVLEASLFTGEYARESAALRSCLRSVLPLGIVLGRESNVRGVLAALGSTGVQLVLKTSKHTARQAMHV